MALTLDAAKWRKKRGMKRLLAALGADDGLTRYVGGAVRDDLLGLQVSDIDLATQIPPDEVIRRLEKARIKAIPTGIDHGTVTAVSDGQTFEVTTLRRDVSTDGRRATVSFTDDWKEDAARRDFTINALFADPRSGELFDYFGGLADLEHRHIRFIGDPLQRIAEDHLRILRFFRFHARFDAGEPDAAALDACAARANDLMALSRERIADELLKLLALPDPSHTVAIMLDRGILRPVLPEIKPECARRSRALIAAERDAGDRARRAAATIRACSPATPSIAEEIAARLRLSNKARKRLACAAALGRSIAASAGLSRRNRVRGRPPAAGRSRRRRRRDRRLACSASADQWRRVDQARPGRRPARRAHACGRSRIAGSKPAFPTGEAFDRIVEEAIGRRLTADWTSR